MINDKFNFVKYADDNHREFTCDINLDPRMPVPQRGYGVSQASVSGLPSASPTFYGHRLDNNDDMIVKPP